MLLSCSVRLENQKKQRQGDNVFAIYPQIDGKATATVGQFKADDSPAGSLMLPCSVQLGSLAGLKENQNKQRQGDNATTTVGPFKADDSPAGSMLLYCSVQLGLKKNQNKQRQGDNVFAIYPQIDGKGTTTVGTFKADDSPTGSMLLYCSVQLGKLGKL
ncbi:hypothetical protein Bca4012_089235 [Brassica carinata]|uniref:Uncharacterized protein n=1 Tax=Brassica carinata TaxID=52824 RepID=A0A8X7PBB3_BRACI|nr:hypothetical protein Bca52824_087246 [Brassica carinata]